MIPRESQQSKAGGRKHAMAENEPTPQARPAYAVPDSGGGSGNYSNSAITTVGALASFFALPWATSSGTAPQLGQANSSTVSVCLGRLDLRANSAPCNARAQLFGDLERHPVGEVVETAG